MVDDALAQELSRHWYDGWNGYDLETIMSPYADDVVFSSPFVERVSGDPAKTTITGYDAVRDYVETSLRRVPGIRYTLDATFVGTDSVVLLYTVHLPDGSDKTGCDLMRVNAHGKVVEWRCHYHAFTPADTAHLMRD